MPEKTNNAETIRAALRCLKALAPPLVDEALAALEEMERDTRRLDWLESERERERESWAIFERANPRGALPPAALFRKNLPITRAAIDAAMQPPGTQSARDIAEKFGLTPPSEGAGQESIEIETGGAHFMNSPCPACSDTGKIPGTDEPCRYCGGKDDA